MHQLPQQVLQLLLVHHAQHQIHKIQYHERESEKFVIRLLKSIFAGNYPLERKCHLRDHLIYIDQLSNQADETGDALAIYAVKRSI